MGTIVCFYHYLINKDNFGMYYHNLLAKRLLNLKGDISLDIEKSAVSYMKQEGGVLFTSKFEGMINDINLSKQCSQTMTDNLHVTVLTSGYWPSYPVYNIIYPCRMLKLHKKFTDAYSSLNSSRLLKWLNCLGNVTLNMQLIFGSDVKMYDVTLHTLQAVLILAIDDLQIEGSKKNTEKYNRFAANSERTFISFAKIQEMTGIKDVNVLKKLLHSLACCKFRLLSRQNNVSKNVQASSTDSNPSVNANLSRIVTTDNFAVNFQFASTLKKFRIPMVNLQNQSTNTVQELSKQRSHHIDACIIRIMKAKKILSHAELNYEVLKRTASFQPDSKTIKFRIENLIERDYLERTGEDLKTYKYVP